MITAADIQMIRNADPGAVLPGIDTMTGNPYATSTLLDVTKITQNSSAPYSYSPSRNTVYVKQDGAVLSGINFGAATVMIDANNVTIKDCTFTGTTGFWAVCQSRRLQRRDGGKLYVPRHQIADRGQRLDRFQAGHHHREQYFLNSPVDAIDIHSGVVTGNYFSAAAYAPGAHADAICVTSSTGPTTITNNFIDGTQNADAPGQPE